MADTYGIATIPLGVTTPAGDPALRDIVDYAQAVLNTYCGSAWTAIAPNEGDVVRSAHTHDPRRGRFIQKDLPALYIWRERGKLEDFAESIKRDEDVVQLWWVYPPTKQEVQQGLRDTLGPTIAKVLHACLERGRDPSWVKDDDDEENAAAIAVDADSIKLSVATSLTPQTYSGAALDGIVGDDVMAPRRSLRLTTVEETGAYNPTDPVVWTYINWYDQEATVSLQPTANGGDSLNTTIEAKQVVSIDVPGQVTEDGAFQFGTGARPGRGSVLLQTTGMREIRLVEWKLEELSIPVTDQRNQQSFAMPYRAIAMTLRVREDLVFDLSDTTRFHPHDEIENDFVDEDESLIEQQELPDEGA